MLPDFRNRPPYDLARTYSTMQKIDGVGQEEDSADVWFLDRMGVTEF